MRYDSASILCSQYITRCSSFAANSRDFEFQDSPVSFKTPQHQPETVTPASTIGATSLFSPSALSQTFDLSMGSLSEESPQVPTTTTKDKLNCFLAARDISPIRTTMVTPWDVAADRTKRHYLRKARQIVSASLEEISPDNAEMMFKAMKQIDDGVEDLDCTLLESLAECYENASHWRSRRQILSIFADKVYTRIIS